MNVDTMNVAIVKNPEMDYCREAPFHPQERYPEYPFGETCARNPCYGEVRNVLRRLGLDRENYDKRSWNPLGDIIRPGDRVFIKPNFVSHFNPVDTVECMITQGSVIRAILDYVYIALDGRGSIAIGDAPSIEADFDVISRITGLGRIVEYYGDKRLKPAVMDLRKEKGHSPGGKLMPEPLAGDPRGYSVVDLGEDSALAGIMGDYKKFRANNYDWKYMLEHHNGEKNEYYIANSILEADVVVNLPKLKTHCRSGITCALKNLVGINGYKSWLPHHRSGSPADGGDEYQHKDLRKDLIVGINDRIAADDGPMRIVPLRTIGQFLYYSKFVVPFKDDLYGGSWHGNDTIPRTISDLNRIIFYADRSGKLRDVRQRRMFILVDGVIGGEKEGPQTPSAIRSGVLVAGCNPVEVDLVCSRLMGFDYGRMATFRYAMDGKRYPIFNGRPDDIRVLSDRCMGLGDVHDALDCHFAPPRGWKGHIEFKKEAPAGEEARVPAT